ncbi:bifunctional DNA primase/polymerase [Clostridium swellfunianum]|uniref:bifunctional DNA primase/polymerase n=1 Tax=Clostridium swellfunianum TaxID=1367462 RepID=UPI00202FE125|nr:bifunctional DNA primase/polymerase [Clostridium swellfunianum]MCM0648431.1 bifunctional DNA primase/polymerase [Clostridium swellfunianum]
MDVAVIEKMKKAAKELASKGMPIFECEGKIPMTKGWTNITNTTLYTIDGWFRGSLCPSFGLALGERSSIVGIDIDGEEALSVLEEISKGDLPKTWSFKTPGEGKRLLYKTPVGTITKKFKITLGGNHKELAFLGTGQQTIMPPSFHKNGGQYEWIEGLSPDEIDIAAAPDWLLEIMSGKSKPVAKEQGGNNRSFSYEMSEQGMSDKIAEYQCTKFSEHCPMFKEAMEIQMKEGLPEDDWFLIICLLVNSDNEALAYHFSRMCHKHDTRSEERIQKLIEERDNSEDGCGTPRCTTFGCRRKHIGKCFNKIIKDEDGKIKNSPSAFLYEVTKIDPPSDPKYSYYLDRLRFIKDIYLDEKGNLCMLFKGAKVTLANFILRITKEIIKTDGLKKEHFVCVEGLLENGLPINAQNIKLEEYESMNWLIKECGSGAIIFSGQGYKDKVREVIQRISGMKQREQIFTHTGWCNLAENRRVYLHYGGAIGAEDVKVELDKGLSLYKMPSKITDIKSAIGMSLKILNLASLKVTIPMLAVVYLSTLVQCFKDAGLSPDFIVWLHGITGSRKTFIAKMLLSHFGDFAYNSPPASFRDTENSIEKRAHCLKDSLLLVDDYHPNSIPSEAMLMRRVAEKLLRMYGDRTGRGRLNSNTDLQATYIPRGMAIATGEDLPLGQSSNARYIGLEIVKSEINLDVLTELQHNSVKLRESMLGFIRFIINNGDRLTQEIKAQFEELRHSYNSSNVHGRVSDAAAYLEVAFYVFLEYAHVNEVIDQNKREELLNTSKKVFEDIIANQSELIKEQNVEVVFIEALKEMFNTRKIRVENLVGTNQTEFSFGTGEFIGYCDNEFYYLYPQITYDAVNSFLSKSNRRISIIPKMMWKNLAAAEMIKTESQESENPQNLPKKAVKINGREKKRVRLLHIPRNIID